MPFRLSSKSMFRFLQSSSNLVTAAVADSVMQSCQLVTAAAAAAATHQLHMLRYL